jgi:hypothetical protein
MRLPCVYVPLKYEVFRWGFEGEVQGARRLDEVENTFELARPGEFTTVSPASTLDPPSSPGLVPG